MLVKAVEECGIAQASNLLISASTSSNSSSIEARSSYDTTAGESSMIVVLMVCEGRDIGNDVEDEKLEF